MNTETPTPIIRLHPSDNVVVARIDLSAGTVIPGEGLTTCDHVPAGHKIATVAIPSGQPVKKYSQLIGFATCDISPGEPVHSHNMALKTYPRDFSIGAGANPTDYIPEKSRATFNGIVRPDGRIGTRNYIGILPTSNCSASVARLIADQFRDSGLEEFHKIDGVVALCHGTGCGTGGTGKGFEIAQRTIEGYAKHPNFGGVLLVGLGCEELEMDVLMGNLRSSPQPMRHSMMAQELGGTRRTVNEGVARIRAMLGEVNDIVRCPVPASRLILGLECGGSDAYSGITANPALGAATDLLVRNGGTAILSETPEIYGAEHLLIRRAASQSIGESLAELIRWWESYTTLNGCKMENNPSPGNKSGGLTTIFEKSLGAVAKGGTTNLEAVYGYAEPVTSSGLVFMDTPGYDPPSVTGMVAGGANMICFTTGRGSLFGCKPVPVIKLASRTELYQSMSEDMDVNCGTIVDGDTSIEVLGERIFKRILAVASGEKTKSEVNGFGDNEFLPWHIGVMI